MAVNLATGTGTGGTAQGDVLSGIENVEGSSFNDTLTGDGGDNVLTGGDGADSLVGGAGNDTLLGGNGNDTLVGGAGADSLDGGSGVDRVDYSGSAAAINIDLKTGIGLGGDAQGDTLNAIEDAIGSAFDDTIIGSDGANVLQGGAGNDAIHGGSDASADSILGGDGKDLITETGGAGSNDTISGGAGSDTISAGGGADTIAGGTGDDQLTGGDGNDVFVYSPGDGLDTITDFNFGNGGTLDDGAPENNDVLDLTAFYCRSLKSLISQPRKCSIIQSGLGAGQLDGDDAVFSGCTETGPHLRRNSSKI